MVHTSVAYARQTRPAADLGRAPPRVGPGSTNMVTGAALATINRMPVLLLPADTFADRAPHPGAAGARAPVRRRRHGQRRLPAGLEVLRPDQPSRAAAVGAPRRRCGCSPTRSRPARSRRAAAGRAGRGPRLAGRALRAGGSGTSPGRCPRPRRSRARGGRDPFGQAAARRRRRRRRLLPRPTRRSRAFCEATGIPVGRDPGRQGVAGRTTTRSALGAVGSTGTTAANALAREADVVIGIGTRYSDFTTASRTAFQNPDVRFVNINVAPRRRGQARRARRRRRRARGAGGAHRRACPATGCRRNTSDDRHAALAG